MRPAVAALALVLALPLCSMAAEVKVQPGETLSEIADRVGVSMKRLMEINNLSDPDHLEAGSQLKLPAGVSARASSSGTVTVGEGETLSDIADRHGVSVSTLIALNSLSDPNHVEVGQVLKLKGSGSRPTSAAPTTASTTPSYSYAPGASEHVVRKGESLSAIARGYGVSVSQLVALNAIANPNNVPAGSTLRLSGGPLASSTATPVSQPRPAVAPQPKPARVAAAPRPARAPVQEAASGKSDWRTYGPLQVDWSSWQPMGGSMVAAMVNPKGESLYTAINCSARKINSTNGSGLWGSWNDPASEVETKLVNDFCSRRGG
ncbi:MAG: LysM peptidoglycan-binding domain-containing protein [Cyanobacteriota bacterium]|nr:LysM peptidoglycan-binding domain-containing protein [Cyanobacteriota bacterium]